MATPVASSRVKFEIALRLNQVCSRVNGAAVYQDGWSDVRVAGDVSKTTGEDVSHHSVSLIRTENFGSLRQAKPEDPIGEVLARLANLERRVTDLEKSVIERLGTISDRLGNVEGCILGPHSGETHVNGKQH